MRFRQIRGVKHSVFPKNAEWNSAFSAITQYSRKSGYVLEFNTYLNKIFEILGLGLVYCWMMPKNCEKRNIKSRACVHLSCVFIYFLTNDNLNFFTRTRFKDDILFRLQFGDYRYSAERMTWDPNCYECKVRYRDPKPKDLVMYLHAWVYKVNKNSIFSMQLELSKQLPAEFSCHCSAHGIVINLISQSLIFN